MKQLGEAIQGIIVKIKNGKPTVIVIDGERYVLDQGGAKK